MLKKRFMAVFAASIIAMSFSGIASADQDDLGVVGDPNCHGQRMSYHASTDDGRGTPKERADANPDHDNAGEINKAVREICDAPGT